MKNAANSLENLSKAELINALQAAQDALRERDNIIHILHEKLRLIGAKTYGVRSEQRSNDPQSDLFNEAEQIGHAEDDNSLEAGSIIVDDSATATDEQSETITYTRRKRPGRKPLPESRHSRR